LNIYIAPLQENYSEALPTPARFTCSLTYAACLHVNLGLYAYIRTFTDIRRYTWSSG